MLFIGWNRAVPGRTQQVLELFPKYMEFCAKLQADGRIESFEPVILSAHGGDLNGFLLIRGDAQKLAEIRQDDAFNDLVLETNINLLGVGVVNGYIGEGITNLMSRVSKLIGE